MAISSRAIPQTNCHTLPEPLKAASDIRAITYQVSLRSRRAGRICAQTSGHLQGVKELRKCVGFRFQPRAGLLLLAAGDASPRLQDRSLICSRAMSDTSAASQDWEEPDSSVVTEFQREARDGEVLAGSVICQIWEKEDGMHLYIKSLEVDPAYRRQKIGSMLMKDCLSGALREYNIVEAHVHVPTIEVGAIAFFQRCGFTLKKRIQNYNVGTEYPDCYLFSKKGGIWWNAPDPGTPFRPENVNYDLIEPANVVAEFEKQAEWPGEAVAGIITCQVLHTADLWYHLYIKSLVVNEPYRRQTVGTQLLKICLDFAVSKFGVVEAFAYVPSDDFCAMAFCEKSGFTRKQMLQNFFKDTQSPDCFIYSKQLLSKD